MEPPTDHTRASGTTGHAFRPSTAAGTNRLAIALAAVLILAALGGGAWYWWQQRHPGLPDLTPAAAPAPPPVAAAPSAPAEPAIQHPLDVPAEAASAVAPPALDRADAAVRQALVGLLGQDAVASMLQTDDFVRRAVATVDNLGRNHAPARMWPVAPARGRFGVQRSAEGELIADTNAARYDTFVALVASVDARRAATTYRGLYPLFQRAYQELGYPRGYFNDRLVQVIDQMLATPEPATPPVVRLVEVKGPAASSADRPWTRYEFADPALEALPAGSKMLLRMGPVHAQRLKAQLRALRAEIARR